MESPNRLGSEGAPASGVPGNATGLIDTSPVEDWDIFSALLDTLSALVVVLDHEGRIVRFNRACERTTGYSTEEVVGRRVWDLFLTPQDVEPMKAVFEQLPAGEFPKEHENVWLTREGERRLIAWSNTALPGRAGKVAYVIATGIDITEQREAQQRIQEQNKFLTSILESVTHPLYVVDVGEYTVQMANSAAYAGSLPDGATCYELFHGLSKPCPEVGYPCPLEEIKKTKTNVTAEHVHRDPDGSRRIVEVQAYPLLDDQGEVTAVIEYCLDITDRKEMEEALREAKGTAERARREERRRRREAERRRQIAESLTTVLAALNSNQPVDEVLNYIAEQAIELLDTQAVGICQLTGDPQALVLKASHCLPQTSGTGAHLPAGTQALERAMKLRQVVKVPCLTANPAAPPTGPCDQEPFRALLAAPIILQDEAYGGAAFYYSRPRSFSDEDVELAIVFSNQIAQAIENAQLREQIQEAAATAERNRLARDLHDSVTQALFSATLVAETLPRIWQRDPDEAREGLEELRDLTYGALAEMRTLLLELRPSALLETELDDLLVQLSQAITSRAQLPVRMDIAPSPPLPEDVQVTFYRVAQEALNNAIKHAEASELTVSLEVTPPVPGQQEDGWQGRVELRVRDDGQGFKADSTPASCLGLGIMRERAEAIGASLSIESQVDEGTEVIVAWEGNQP